MAGTMGKQTPVAMALVGLALSGCGPISVNTVAVSPDGSLAFAVDAEGDYSFLPSSEKCDIVLTDASGTKLRRITANGLHNSWATFSPDGKTLLCVESVLEQGPVTVRLSDGRVTSGGMTTYVVDTKLVLRDIATGEAGALCRDKDIDFLVFPEFSPDGKKVACLSERHLKVVSVPAGETLASWRRVAEAGDFSGPVGFKWISSRVLFMVYAEGVFGGTTERGIDIDDALLARLGVAEVGTGQGAGLPAWKGKTYAAATFAIPWISAREGVAVVPLFGMEPLPPQADFAQAPLQLWVYSEEGIRRLTNDGNHYYYAAISPDGRSVAAVSTPAHVGENAPAAGEDADHEPIIGPGDLVLIDMGTAEITRIAERKACYPFWLDAGKLGYVSVDVDKDEEHIIVLDLRAKRRFDLTRALAPRLEELFGNKGG